jgi:hypothetical protein
MWITTGFDTFKEFPKVGQNGLYSKGFLIFDQFIARDFSSHRYPPQTLTDRNMNRRLGS